MHMVFRNTLLMCISAFPQFKQFDVTKDDLDEWYDWFWGRDIAGRTPAPSDYTLMLAERKAWREVHNLVYKGETLKSALETLRKDYLFWQREVYERIYHNKGGGKGKLSKKGKSKGQGYRAPYWSPVQSWKQNQDQNSGPASSRAKEKARTRRAPKMAAKHRRTGPKDGLRRTHVGSSSAETFTSARTAKGIEGEIGWFLAKQIVSALPEPEERPLKVRRKVTVDGWEKEEEEEERREPITRRQLERMHMVFRNTQFMCISAFPQFKQFDVTKDDLDEWYDWFWGRDISC